MVRRSLDGEKDLYKIFGDETLSFRFLPKLFLHVDKSVLGPELLCVTTKVVCTVCRCNVSSAHMTLSLRGIIQNPHARISPQILVDDQIGMI